MTKTGKIIVGVITLSILTVGGIAIFNSSNKKQDTDDNSGGGTSDTGDNSGTSTDTSTTNIGSGNVDLNIDLPKVETNESNVISAYKVYDMYVRDRKLKALQGKYEITLVVGLDYPRPPKNFSGNSKFVKFEKIPFLTKEYPIYEKWYSQGKFGGVIIKVLIPLSQGHLFKPKTRISNFRKKGIIKFVK